MDRWCGRVALVTGAAGGVGSALAERLVKYGIKVVGCDLNVESITTAAYNLKSEKGELHPVKCNLRNESEILSMIAETKQKYGGVDVCINVAAQASLSSLLAGETEKWRDILEVNVLGLSICTREAIKSMRERGVDDGHVIHFSSIAGHVSVGLPAFSMYTATKHTILALTEELRRELRLDKSNIRVSCISPGFIMTPIFERIGGKECVEEFCKPDTPMLTPDQVVDAVIYMLSCPAEVQVHDLIVRPTQQIM